MPAVRISRFCPVRRYFQRHHTHTFIRLPALCQELRYILPAGSLIRSALVLRVTAVCLSDQSDRSVLYTCLDDLHAMENAHHLFGRGARGYVDIYHVAASAHMRLICQCTRIPAGAENIFRRRSAHPPRHLVPYTSADKIRLMPCCFQHSHRRASCSEFIYRSDVSHTLRLHAY